MGATLSSSQVVCSYCEEMVHRYAARCPYCQHDLTSPNTASTSILPEFRFEESNVPHKESHKQSTPKSSPVKQSEPQPSKITPFVPGAFCDLATRKELITKSFKTVQPKACPPLVDLKDLASVDDEPEEKQAPSGTGLLKQESILKVVFSLIFLLAGSFFAFFGLILKLFSKDGKLVLEWNAESWPYYLFPALIILLIGMAVLPHSEHDASS